METSPIVYLEIPAPNIELAEKFYSSIFNWEIKESNLTDNKYSEFRSGDNSISGGLDSSKAVQSGGIIFYVRVKNIDSIIKQVLELKGEILRNKFDIGGGHGFSAILKDPNGNQVGLVSYD